MGTGLHARDCERHRLVPGDGLAEGVALLRVLDALVDAALRETGCQRSNRDAALIQDP